MSDEIQETPVAEQELPAADTGASETTETQEPVVQEVTPAVVVETASAETPAVSPIEPVAATVVEAEPARELTAFEQQIEQLKKTGTTEQLALIGNLEAYMAKMQPGMPVVGQEGASTQLSFWLTLKNLLTNASEGQFRNLWSIVLAYFHEYGHAVFHDSYIYRFSEHWTQSKKELDTFHRVLNLIKVSANPKTRDQTKKQVDLDKIVHSLPEVASQRLIGFYNKK